MTSPTPDFALLAGDERQQLNAALHTARVETGFWDHTGRPAPWPDDIEDWTANAPNSHLRTTRAPAPPKHAASPASPGQGN